MSYFQEYALSDTAKSTATEILKILCDAFLKDPLDAVERVQTLRKNGLSIPDQIFLENLQTYLLNVNEYDFEQNAFLEDNMQKLSAALAEASPNEEAEYEGNPEKLNEYAKRILKAIDDCGTKQKAVYLANCTRALANKKINKAQFFKFVQCIRQLTEEDLLFLSEHVGPDKLETDEDYIDDFRSLGLMKESNGGFVYTMRAYNLVNMAIRYENPVPVPDKIEERNIAEPVSSEEIADMFNNNFPDELKQEIADEAAPKWKELTPPE